MSTHYIIIPNIALDKIKSEEKFGINITTKIDGDKMTFNDVNGNYVHFSLDQNNNVTGFERFGQNNPENIIEEIESIFGSVCIDEHNESYNRITGTIIDSIEKENEPKLKTFGALINVTGSLRCLTQALTQEEAFKKFKDGSYEHDSFCLGDCEVEEDKLRLSDVKELI